MKKNNDDRNNKALDAVPNNDGAERRNVIDAEVVEEIANEAKDGPVSKPDPQPFWMDLMMIIGVYVVMLFIGKFVGNLLMKGANADQSLAVFVTTIIQYPIVIGFSLWLLKRRGAQKPILSFSLKKADPTLILWGLLLLIATSVVVEPLIGAFSDEHMDGMRKYIVTGGGLAMFTSVLLAPILEEILFRGIIQESSSRAYGTLAGIFIASGVFAIVHLNPQQMINAFFCGIILGYIYYRTKSLIPVIIIHAVNNALAYILIRMFDTANVYSLRQMISGDVWYWIVYGVCAALFILALVNLWVQLNKNDKKLK